jgi:ParB family chromosome partitioning protein
MLEIGQHRRERCAGSITGVHHPDNSDVIRVRDGQRRTLAAGEVGLTAVPVFVLPSSAADAEETIERIVHQIVTNDQKQDLTDAQRARGIQQMIDAGLSVTKVAKSCASTAACSLRLSRAGYRSGAH